jgi:hypothetical protein
VGVGVGVTVEGGPAITAWKFFSVEELPGDFTPGSSFPTVLNLVPLSLCKASETEEHLASARASQNNFTSSPHLQIQVLDHEIVSLGQGESLSLKKKTSKSHLRCRSPGGKARAALRAGETSSIDREERERKREVFFKRLFKVKSHFNVRDLTTSARRNEVEKILGLSRSQEEEKRMTRQLAFCKHGQKER